jgi:outer membrane protein assembly factor BamB
MQQQVKTVFRFSACLLCASVPLWLPLPVAAADWLHWRGPEQDGVSRETDLPDKFSTDPAAPNSNLVWKAPYGCRSTPMVMGGRVFVINSDGEGLTEGERVMALDAKTGKVLWEHKFNVWHTDIVSSRVGWTNLAGDPETDSVYAHGVQGLFMCLDAKTGQVRWQRSLTEEYGRVSGYGGRVVSPTVDGDLVIVGMINASWGDQARGGDRFVAFDKRTGQVVWWSDPCSQMRGTYYSNPIVKVVNGQRLLITGAADGELIALQVRTGVKVWSFPVGANVINTSPVMEGNYVYVTHGEENSPDDPMAQGVQGRVVCVDAAAVVNGRPTLVWQEYGVKAGLASPLVHDGKLYVPDDFANLHCFDAKTGKKLWRQKYGKVSRGAPVWADGKIYVAEVNAHFHIFKPEERRCRELHDQFFPSKGGQGFVEIAGTPAVADGRIYFATRDEIYCIGKTPWNGSAGAVPPEPTEPAPGANERPAHLQVVPADTELTPGQSTTFRLRVFDAAGRALGKLGEYPGDAWALPLPPKTPTGAQPPALQGEVASGKLTVARQPPAQQGTVEAKLGSLTAAARVRVAPALPYRNDFERAPVGAAPAGWVNVQGKFAVVDLNGNKVLKKLANDSRPPLAKANAFIGLPDLKDYTIQADLSATSKNNNLPDMGIVNARYTLQLNGNKQEVRLLSWDALPRIDKTIPFPWKPGTWYRCKLTVDQKGGHAVVRGKVWPRDGSEPAAWTLEVEDPRPNREGSPALYGYATGILDDKVGGAEAFYDNIVITPHGATAAAR